MRALRTSQFRPPHPRQRHKAQLWRLQPRLATDGASGRADVVCEPVCGRHGVGVFVVLVVFCYTEYCVYPACAVGGVQDFVVFFDGVVAYFSVGE